MLGSRERKNIKIPNLPHVELPTFGVGRRSVDDGARTGLNP